MINIVGKRKIWYTLSGTMLVISSGMLFIFGLRLGIDFTGGSLIELEFKNARPHSQIILDSVEKNGHTGSLIQAVGDTGVLLRVKPLQPHEYDSLKEAFSKDLKGFEFIESRFETIGPTISKELREKSITMTVFVIVAIIAYISWTFRRVSRPVTSWKYGVIAVVALLHDITIPAGVFALLGHYYGVEIDILFVTAMLTVMGFSVHDTIVVFDRIRESLERRVSTTFEETVNMSVNTTLARSINTSVTTLLVLFALFFFGGESVRYFSLVMIIGIIVGTYSSICIASPLLVTWHRLRASKN